MTESGEVDLDSDVEDPHETAPYDAPDDWQPEGYEPGPDDPGDVPDECGEQS